METEGWKIKTEMLIQNGKLSSVLWKMVSINDGALKEQKNKKMIPLVWSCWLKNKFPRAILVTM